MPVSATAPTISAGDPGARPAAEVRDLMIDDQLQPLSGTVQDALRDYAAALIPCPKEEVRVREVLLGRPHNPSEVTFADGCGHRVVYGQHPESFNYPAHARYWVTARFALGRSAGSHGN